MRTVPFVHSAGVATLAALAACPAAAQDLNQHIKDLGKLEAELDTSKASKDAACKLAQVAFNAMQAADNEQNAKRQLEAARKASESRETCKQAETRAHEAAKRADEAWTLLKAAVTPAVAVAAVLPMGVAELIESASKAQAAVDAARSTYADPYEAGDSAAALVLGNSEVKKDDLQTPIKNASTSRDSAAAVRNALRAAQMAANQLVSAALQLKSCAPTCADAALQLLAHRSNGDLQMALGHAKTAFTNGKLAAVSADAGLRYPGDVAKQALVVDFYQLLDKYPDARSALGEQSAFGLSASGSATEVAVKIGGARNLPFGWRQTSLTLTAPLKSETNPQLFTRASGFNNAASIRVSTYWLAGASTHSNLPKGDNYMTAGGINVSAGLGGKVDYLDEQGTTKTADRLFREASAGAYMVLFRNPSASSSSSVQVLSLDLKRSILRGNEETRCPAPASIARATFSSAAATAPSAPLQACKTGYFQAPRFGYSRILGYEYRLQAQRFALAPRLEYESGNQQATTVRLPVYLIHSSAVADKGAFNAGLDWAWTRVRNEDGTHSIDRRLGVFVGVPFSMGAPSRE